jgi:hypothetical protein
MGQQVIRYWFVLDCCDTTAIAAAAPSVVAIDEPCSYARVGARV